MSEAHLNQNSLGRSTHETWTNKWIFTKSYGTIIYWNDAMIPVVSAFHDPSTVLVKSGTVISGQLIMKFYHNELVKEYIKISENSLGDELKNPLLG